MYIYSQNIFFAHLQFQTLDTTQRTENKNFGPITNPTQPAVQINTRTTLVHCYIALAVG